MFNDTLGKYDTAIPIRQLMQQHRVDISLMDFVAWSPQACKELKRMCTRVSKKRERKQNASSGGQPQVPQQAIPLLQQPFVPQIPQLPQYSQFPMQQLAGPAQFQLAMQAPPYQTQPLQQAATQSQTQQQVLIKVLSQQSFSLPPHSSAAQSSSLAVYRTEAERAWAERHTRALSSKLGKDKQYRIEVTIKKENGKRLPYRPRVRHQCDFAGLGKLAWQITLA